MRSKPMNCAVGRMKGLHIVEIIRDCPHLNHAIPVVSSESLDLRSSDRKNNVSDETSFMITSWSALPVLKPHLDLSWAKPWNFSRQTLSMSSIRVRLFSEFAHEKSGLLVSEPVHC